MNYPPDQLEFMQQMDILSKPFTIGICALWVCIALGYLVYTKRFFLKAGGEADIAQWSA